MLRSRVAVLLVPVALVGCAQAEFQDEESKRQAWDVYQCSLYRDVEARAASEEIRADIVSGEAAEGQAQEWADTLDQAVTDLEHAQVRHVMPMASVGDFKNMCTGWLWDYRKTQLGYLDGYESFTLQDARDAGVLREGPFG